VRYALLTTITVAALPAMAADGTPAANAPIQEVVVTGSRISSPNLTSISPVSTVTADDIAIAGKVRVEDILNQLPQAFAAQGSNVSNGASGTATVNLRGLGAKRTLVLVNGRRLMPGNPDTSPNDDSGAADLNQIPRQLIERVEVLTGGASSVYGADAVGGVVNFIMNTRFEGIKVEATYGFNNHHNDNNTGDVVQGAGFATPKSNVDVGFTKDFAVVLGGNFAEDRGNATFYATYREVDAVLQGDFDFSACTFNSGDSFSCGGSGTTFPSRLRVRSPDGTLGPNLILDRTTGNLRPFNADTDAFNFGPLNYFQRPDERYTAGVYLNFDVQENMTAYGELMFMDDRSVAQIAPSGSFGQEFSVSCSNPLFSAAQRQTFCGQFGLGPTDNTSIVVGRRNVEGGGRQSDISHESYRAVVGLKGDISEAWSYDVYGQYGSTDLKNNQTNDFSIVRLGRALDVVAGPNGQPTCRSVLDGSDLNCVPYNVFAVNGVTPDQINYLQIPLLQTGKTTERVINASFTGDIGTYGVQFPTADTGLLINIGAEYRQELSELDTDASLQTGDGAGQGGPTLPISGDYEARDLFLEARMAILDNKPWAQSLSAEAGYRYSDYDLDFTTDTYKAGLEWTPIEDIRARVSFQRAVRVPSTAELFGTQSVGLDGTVDICAGPNPTLTLAQCARTGVTPAQFGNIDANPAAQYNAFLGGNPNLQPETADTLSFGLAFQPRFAPGLRLQIDYFDIDIEDAIQDPNADFTLLQCALNGDPTICARVQRDRDGSLFASNDGFIVNTLLNIGQISTKGFDLDASYRREIGSLGQLGLNYKATFLDELETTPQSGVTYDCSGLFGGICGVPAPEYRHKVDATWRTPWSGLDVTLSWRFFDEVKRDAEDSNPFLGFLGQVTGVLPTDSKLGSRSYLDLSATMNIGKSYNLQLTVNNLADKDPPLVGSDTCPTGICNGNTYAQVYDVLGRQLFFGFTATF
jgi:outer membrane receptor protein involved in Fe transport